ncbi:FCD domain-containing protein [Nakamurella sp. YIM 132087]|uniref:FCD domain-containing protein n=1 Tax=Nakamurella alba TaxID=2665158 RepID=A0A7K1FE05_9ACTN|nr:FCD domain-containing protein [Nakamurella alba]
MGLREQAIARLRHDLVTGRLEPDRIYSASAIAVEMGVSNSPVREALLALVSEGLLEPVRNRGYRIAPQTQKDQHDIYELRLDLEVPAMHRVAVGGLIAGREQEFRALAADIVAFEAQGDLVTYLEVDRRFHLGLLELLGNKHLVNLVANLRDRTRQYGIRSLSARGMLSASAAEHLPLCEAVVAGDGPLAELLMHQHLQHIIGDWHGT